MMFFYISDDFIKQYFAKSKYIFFALKSHDNNDNATLKKYKST